MPFSLPILALTLAVGADAAAWEQAETPPRAGVSLASGVDDLSVLTRPDSDEGARFDAARRLVLRTDDATAAALVGALRDETAPSTQRAVARAIASAVPGSPRFSGALREGLERATSPECVADILAAMNDYPVRPMAQAAIARLVDDDTPAKIRELLSGALVRWTGCEPCASRGAEGWRAWWQRVEAMDDAAWRGELASNFRARAERLGARNAELGEKVVELFSALYSATPEGERSAIIASMLRDPLPRANRLGLDFASRTLLNAQSLSDDVARAAVALLASRDESVRADAARLLENLGAPVPGEALVAALTLETSERVAAPLLRAVSRNGVSTPVDTMIRWLRAEEPATGAAADAIHSANENHGLSTEEIREVLDVFDHIDPVQASASHTRLLASLAEPSDETLRDVALSARSASARAAAAKAIARDRAAAEFVIAGAARDAAWFDGAALAVELHRPTASSFLELIRVASDGSDWITPAARTLVAMPSDQRLIALRAVRDASVRDSLLGATIPGVEERREEEARELHLLLAETRLELGRAESALVAAERAMRNRDRASDRANRVRFYALVDLGRLAEALAATPGEPPVFWLEALRRCARSDHAAEVLGLIDEHFLAQMTRDQRGALDALRREIEASPPAKMDGDRSGEGAERDRS